MGVLHMTVPISGIPPVGGLHAQQRPRQEVECLHPPPQVPRWSVFRHRKPNRIPHNLPHKRL